MAKGFQRKAVGSVAARRRARELRSEYEVRDLALLEGAEEFLTLQERAEKVVEGIDEQIEKMEAARERARREGWEAGAVVAARMRALQVRGVAVREDEVADRLGVDVGELRRLVAHVKASVSGSAAVVPAGGERPAGTGRAAGGAQRAAGGDGPGAGVRVAPGGPTVSGGGPAAAGRPVVGGAGQGGGPAAPGSGDGVREVR
ncbi:hypothetical protein PUR61_38560 [Streptomyces sp. BE20]|uniref:hypothetical protein n=1 Tax=Streptomyces sp. BE20 TaxID=3002525 RepID=UPI002E76F73E|nr:hypothetical protein [Streptomyces sp. BE20]MEE1828039.1 hypothetical protein [Streptomyces sp. BE20]